MSVTPMRHRWARHAKCRRYGDSRDEDHHGSDGGAHAPPPASRTVHAAMNTARGCSNENVAVDGQSRAYRSQRIEKPVAATFDEQKIDACETAAASRRRPDDPRATLARRWACQQQRERCDGGGRPNCCRTRIRTARPPEAPPALQQPDSRRPAKNISRQFRWGEQAEAHAVIRHAVLVIQIVEIVDGARVDEPGSMNPFCAMGEKCIAQNAQRRGQRDKCDLRNPRGSRRIAAAYRGRGRHKRPRSSPICAAIRSYPGAGPGFKVTEDGSGPCIACGCRRRTATAC